AAPAPELVTVPAPAREPMVWLNPLRSRNAPTVKALAAEKVLAAPACSVPAVTVVAPELVLAPDTFNVPVPILASPPVPPIQPESAITFAWVAIGSGPVGGRGLGSCGALAA